MKITRRTKLLVVALALCFTTMIGSTFAWFTDSVESENNVINAGTLDVELYVSDNGTDWTKVEDGSAPIFNYDKWEPGYATYKFFQVKNAGNLALKFQLNLKADSAITGEYKLADVIDVYTGTQVPTRAKLGTKVGTLSELMNDVDGAAYGVLEAGQTTAMCITLKMQESAGNEYQGLSVGTGFSLQLLATQAMKENDSFGNDYDADAGYGVDNWNGAVKTNLSTVEENGEEYILITTAEELAGLAANVNAGNSYSGKTIKLGNNIDLSNREWTPIGTWSGAFKGNFDGQDYTISNLFINLPEEATGSGVGLFGVAQNATIKNINLSNVNVTGYEMVAAVIGSPYTGCTISDCHVFGNINIVAEYAYAGGIAAYGYTSYDNCSVIANGTGTITAKERNAVGGITAWMLEGNNKITNCTVKNLNLTGWTNIGAITGFVHYSNIIDSCTAENINLTKTRVDGHPGIGLASGGWSYNANKAITITNNTFKNIILNGTAVAKASANYMYGSEYAGNDNSNFVLRDNTEEDIQNNIVFVTVVTVGTADELANLNQDMLNGSAGENVVVKLTADIDFAGKTWTPVDSHADKAFTFAGLLGDGHTISNLTVNGQAMFTRFAGTGNVFVKDVTFDNANINSNGKINTSILTVQTYQNVLLDNVDVKNSTISGGYKVAPLIATVYNESDSTITATLKNCDVSNVTVKATSYDFCTTGMVAFVYADNNDKIEFENCTVSNVKLIAPDDSYKAHAWVYTTGSESLYDEVNGVTVTNCSFEKLN